MCKIYAISMGELKYYTLYIIYVLNIREKRSNTADGIEL